VLHCCCWSAGLKSLGCDGFTAHDKEKDVALSSLSNDVLASVEPLLVNCISKLVALVCIHILQNWDVLQELFVLFALHLSRVFYYKVEGATIKCPQLGVRLSNNCGGAGCVVKKG
jgi:hypothetical protein